MDDQEHSRLDDVWRRAFDWVEQTTGGRVVGWRRQGRWRPAWFLDVHHSDGQVQDLYLRCQREENLPWTATLSLRREYDILTVLQDCGALVPRLHGYCPDPEAILMDAVPGRDRFDAGDDQQTRDRVLEQYIEALAHAHSIDPARFRAIGLRKPKDPEEIGYGGFQLSEKWYRGVKTVPDPVNEFIIGWLHRNVPRDRHRTCFLHYDAGQFLHHNGRVTALMDVEFACLGDPLADLGAMRMRDTGQPIGDLMHGYRHYSRITGEPLDAAVINFHAVRFAILTSLLSLGARTDPPSEFDLAQWETWSLMSQRLCLEIIAEQQHIQLQPDEPPPLPEPSRRRPWLHSSVRVLTDVVATLPEDGFEGFRLRIARDMAAAAGRSDDLALEIEERDRRDETALLGRRPKGWQQADAEIEDRVKSAGASADSELVPFLHRRVQRQEMLLRPAMRELKDFTVQRLRW